MNNSTHPEDWIKLDETFKRDTLYHNVGYHLLNGTGWGLIAASQQAVIVSLANQAGKEITPYLWKDGSFRYKLFKILLASKPAALKANANVFVPQSVKEQQEVNNLLREAVSQRAGSKRQRPAGSRRQRNRRKTSKRK